MAEMSPAEFVQSLRFGRDGLGDDQYRRLVQDVVLAWHLGWTAETLRAYLTARQPPAPGPCDGAGSLAAEYRRRLDPRMLPPPPRPDGAEPAVARDRCPAHPATARPCGLCDETHGGRPGPGRIEGADAVRRALRVNAAAFRARQRSQPEETARKPLAERPPQRGRRPPPAWREPTDDERTAEEWQRRRALEALAAMRAGDGVADGPRRSAAKGPRPADGGATRGGAAWCRHGPVPRSRPIDVQGAALARRRDPMR